MAPTPPPPHEDDLREIDWDAVRAGARRLLRAHLSGFGTQDLEDAAQDVSEAMVEFVRRRGRPRSPGGLLVRIVRAIAADTIAERQRDRELLRRFLQSLLAESATDPTEDAVLMQYRDITYHVREYFRLKRASCLSLADSKLRGESLKAHATRVGRSYAQVRQAWTRCVKLIHEAMRTNRLRLGWAVPPPREAAGE